MVKFDMVVWYDEVRRWGWGRDSDAFGVALPVVLSYVTYHLVTLLGKVFCQVIQ